MQKLILGGLWYLERYIMEFYGYQHAPSEILLNICEYVVNSTPKYLNNLCTFRTICKSFCDVSMEHPLGELLRVLLRNKDGNNLKKVKKYMVQVNNAILRKEKINASEPIREYIKSQLFALGVINNDIYIHTNGRFAGAEISFKVGDMYVRIKNPNSEVYCINCDTLNSNSNFSYNAKDKIFTDSWGDFPLPDIYELFYEIVIDIILQYNEYRKSCKSNY